MPVYLVPEDSGRPIVLDKAIVFVGRHPDCDVVLTRSRKVSRKHCCVAQVNEQIVVRDLGSLNGVRVNGERVTKNVAIEFGDEVLIGDVTFVLQNEAVSSAHPGGNGKESADVCRDPMPVEESPVEQDDADHHSSAAVGEQPGAQQPAPDEFSREYPIIIPEDDVPMVDAPEAAPLAEEADLPVDDENDGDDDIL